MNKLIISLLNRNVHTPKLMSSLFVKHNQMRYLADKHHVEAAHAKPTDSAKMATEPLKELDKPQWERSDRFVRGV